MLVNGQEKTLGSEATVKDFLESEGYKLHRVVVEKNGVIVPKKNFETEKLFETDKVEIIWFVGGG
ncbi:MAG: sulfur carrier protein ThiS [Clostridiales bacterium]|jgi:sulfur carrier protein|nr:sulfur carrier protein ThiS [Clostridiales bacterium]